jgi:hypothetical protein
MDQNYTILGRRILKDGYFTFEHQDVFIMFYYNKKQDKYIRRDKIEWSTYVYEVEVSKHFNIDNIRKTIIPNNSMFVNGKIKRKTVQSVYDTFK